MSTPTLSVPESATSARPGRRILAARAPRPRWRRPIVAAALTLIVLGFAARCAGIARVDSITSDESTHLVHSLNFWMTGDDLEMWELGAPRLPHLLNALPSYLLLRHSGRLPTEEAGRVEAITRLVLSGSPRVLVPARAVAIGSGVGLLLAVFWAVARRRGALSGLVAAALIAMVPEVVAHSSIAGSDMAFTAAAFVAVVLMARYAEAPLARPLGGPGAGRRPGLGDAAHGPAAHAPGRRCPTCRAHCGGRGRRASRRPANACWGRPSPRRCWGPSRSPSSGRATASGRSAWRTCRGVRQNMNIPLRIGPIDVSAIPVPTSALSMVKQVRHQNQGHEAYFLGEFGSRGWPEYFPVAFALKTPVGLLILLTLAAARFRPRDAWEWIALACLSLLWVMLLRNKVNIGVRYALLTYPLAVPWLARLFEGKSLRDRVWGPATVAALAWFAWASFSCGDRCLSSFNEIGGGPSKGWLYLADSNVDWGQDFDALAGALDRLGIKDVTTDISSERRLSAPDLYAVANPEPRLPGAGDHPAESPPAGLRRADTCRSIPATSP